MSTGVRQPLRAACQRGCGPRRRRASGYRGLAQAPGDNLEKRFSRGESPVSRAFVTTSLLFCVGPLTIIGSLEVSLKGDYRLLALKSALDFIAALTFASVLGWGVLLSAGTVLVVQGTLTPGANFLDAVVTEPMDLRYHRHRRHPDLRIGPWPLEPQGGQGSQHARGPPSCPSARCGAPPVVVLACW